jgi:hypothetical protein
MNTTHHSVINKKFISIVPPPHNFPAHFLLPEKLHSFSLLWFSSVVECCFYLSNLSFSWHDLVLIYVFCVSLFLSLIYHTHSTPLRTSLSTAVVIISHRADTMTYKNFAGNVGSISENSRKCASIQIASIGTGTRISACRLRGERERTQRKLHFWSCANRLTDTAIRYVYVKNYP